MIRTCANCVEIRDCEFTSVPRDFKGKKFWLCVECRSLERPAGPEFEFHDEPAPQAKRAPTLDELDTFRQRR